MRASTGANVPIIVYIEIGQIIISAIMISIGLLFFYIAYRNETEELQKF